MFITHLSHVELQSSGREVHVSSSMCWARSLTVVSAYGVIQWALIGDSIALLGDFHVHMSNDEQLKERDQEMSHWSEPESCFLIGLLCRTQNRWSLMHFRVVI